MSNKGLGRHESKKDHMELVALWKERCVRDANGTKISSMQQSLNENTFLSAILDIIEFTAVKPVAFPRLC